MFWWTSFCTTMGFILGITVAGAIFEEFPNRGRDHPANREADHKNENKSLWVPSEPIDLYTLVLTVFTGALAFSTIGLWQQTKRLAQGAEDQLVETAKAADAAKASAEIMMHGERAWMHPRETQMAKPDRLFPAPSKGPMPRRPQAVLKAYNVGKTPARIIRYACRFHTVLKDAAPNSPNYGQPIEVSGREIIVFEGLFKHIAPLEEGPWANPIWRKSNRANCGCSFTASSSMRIRLSGCTELASLVSGMSRQATGRNGDASADGAAQPTIITPKTTAAASLRMAAHERLVAFAP